MTISPALIPGSLDPAKLDLVVRAVDAITKRMDAMIVRNGSRADADRYWHQPTSGAILKNPTQPNERWKEISASMYDAILNKRPYWG